MASFALTTARMIVAKPSVAATARAGSASAVRAPMAAAPTMVHNVRALSQRGFVGIAAPRAFAPRQQRAAFSMEAAAEGGGETAGAEGVKLYVGAFRSVPFSSPDVLTNALALRTRAGPPREPSTAPTAMQIARTYRSGVVRASIGALTAICEHLGSRS